MHTDSEAHRQAIDLLRHIGRKPYAFQATLADQCLESVRQRERVIIVAPTGTGKTLVSQLFMALLRRELDAKPRVLVVIPSRGLVAQHFVDASWMRKTVPIALHKINADTPKYQIIETLNSFGIVFTTPITLSRRLALPGARDALRKFDCAIFDEIDVHLTVDEQAERRDTFPALDACMEAQLPILGFTGTGLTRKQIDSWERRRFRKVEAAIPDEWLPLTKVHFVGIADQHVETVDRSIKEELRLAFYKLGWEVPGLANASIGQVKKYAKLGYPSALRILDLCSKRLQLFESPGSTMGKYLALKKLIEEFSPTLVLTRFRESARAIREYLDGEKLPLEIVHGGMSRDQIALRLNSFRIQGKTQKHSLVITRDLGGRGLDFPEAVAAGMFSPRSNHQMVAQELARIRSRRAAPKSVAILYYRNTEEEEKARRLGIHLRAEKYHERRLFEVQGIPGSHYNMAESFESRLLAYEENIGDY